MIDDNTKALKIVLDAIYDICQFEYEIDIRKSKIEVKSPTGRVFRFSIENNEIDIHYSPVNYGLLKHHSHMSLCDPNCQKKFRIWFLTEEINYMSKDLQVLNSVIKELTDIKDGT